MENNDAFQAEVEIDAFNSSTSTQRPLTSSTKFSASAYEAISSSGLNSEENEPLLARIKSRIDDATRVGNESENGEREPPTWSGERDFEGLPWWKTPSIWWLLPAFLLFAIAFGGTIVIKIDLILTLICREYFSEQSAIELSLHVLPVIQGNENPQCRIPEVQSLVSKFTLYGSLLAGISSAIVSPKLGALSDCYGRTSMIVFSSSAMVLSEVVFIIVASNPDSLSVNWVLLGYLIEGLGGSFIAAMAISYAYASDCTAPAKRNVVFGYYQASLFGGIALGPLFAGYIVKATGYILSIFYVALASHCIFLLWLLLIVPESLSKDRQRAARAKEDLLNQAEQTSHNRWSHPISALKRLLKGSNLLAPLTILWPTGPGVDPAVRRNLLFLAAVDTIMFGVAMGSMTIIIIYSNYMFGWGPFETNVFVSISNACRVTALVVVLPLITRLVRGPRNKLDQKNAGCDQLDLGIIRLSVIFDLLGYVGYSLVRTGPLFIGCGIFAAVSGMGSPTLQSSLTKHVPPDRTGQVLGAMGLLHAVARVAAPTIFNLIYAETVGKFDQTVFVCLASTFGLAFALSWCIRPHVFWEEIVEQRRGSDESGRGDHVEAHPRI